MQATRNLHHEIIKVGLGIAQDLVHNPASFDPCNDMFNKDTDTRNHRILGLLCRTECLLSGLFLRLIRQDVLKFNPLETRIFQEDTARRERVICCITHAFVVDASRIGATAVAYQTLFKINKEVIFHRVGFFLPRYFSFCSLGS